MNWFLIDPENPLRVCGHIQLESFCNFSAETNHIFRMSLLRIVLFVLCPFPPLFFLPKIRSAALLVDFFYLRNFSQCIVCCFSISFLFFLESFVALYSTCNDSVAGRILVGVFTCVTWLIYLYDTHISTYTHTCTLLYVTCLISGNPIELWYFYIYITQTCKEHDLSIRDTTSSISGL